MKSFILLLVGAFCICGCAGIQKISVGGGYGDYHGQIDFTLDQEKTDQQQSPILAGSDGKNYAAIELGDLGKIEDLIRGVLGDVGISETWNVKTLLEKVKAAHDAQAAKSADKK